MPQKTEDIRNAALRFDQGNGVIIMDETTPEYRVISVDGLSGYKWDMPLESNALIDGTVLTGMMPRERQVEIRFLCHSSEREFFNHYFNPRIFGRLTLTWNGVTRWIGYAFDASQYRVVQPTIKNNLDIRITLLCDKPFWNHMNDYGRNIAANVPLIAFPFVYPEYQQGFVPDWKQLNNQVPITNAGDADTPIRIVFTCRANVLNPRIEFGNAERFIKVGTEQRPVTMKPGDVIEINTDPEAAVQITINGQSAMRFADPDNEYFQVPPGRSYIAYQCDDGYDNLDAHVYYTPRDNYI